MRLIVDIFPGNDNKIIFEATMDLPLDSKYVRIKRKKKKTASKNLKPTTPLFFSNYYFFQKKKKNKIECE